MPTWQEPPAPAAGQFYLLTGKVAQHTQFATQNNQLAARALPDNPLWINTQPAAKRGIADGDEVLGRERSGQGQGDRHR